MRALKLLLLLGLTTVGLRAQIIDITSQGTPIEGINSGNYAVTGVEVNQQNQYPPTNMTDGSINSSDQTFGSSAYAGLVGITAPTLKFDVTSITVNFAIFYDGGWFGPNGQDSLDQEEQASGGTMQAPLTSADLANLPTLQITTDGINWTDVGYNSNYVSQLLGIYHYNEVISPTVTFYPTSTITDIDGIRLIGTSGGISDFIGVSDFHVYATPEPSTYALLGVGLLALLAYARKRKTANT